MFNMNVLSFQERAAVIKCSVDGNSMRATSGITGIARNTIDKLLVELGSACSEYQDVTLRNLSCRHIQVDEIWAFCYCKEKQAMEATAETRVAGDVWTWAGIDADTKLVPCWTIGKRDPVTAEVFVSDMASRLASRVQLTSDGLSTYFKAIVKAFGENVDYARLVKIYEADPEAETRKKETVIGDPDPKHISTSYIERQNLTMRMGMRRFTRLTNGFGKKVENHAAAISLHMMYYNFARVHQTSKTTPAVTAGVADHVWTVEEIVALLDSN
jgi:IS1 family transposase